MSYEERESPEEPSGPRMTKWDLLRVAAQCGAVLGDRDVPYEDAHRHAAELVDQGLLLEASPPFGGSGVRWYPTMAGRILGTAPQR